MYVCKMVCIFLGPFLGNTYVVRSKMYKHGIVVYDDLFLVCDSV